MPFFTSGMKKLIFFDFDGVILDSFDIGWNIFAAHKPGLTLEVYRTFFEGNVYEVDRETKVDHSIEAEVWVKYRKEMVGRELISGIREVIEKLSKDYFMVIVSSTHSKIIEEFLETHGVRKYFKEVLGSDVDENKVKKIKLALKTHKTDPKDTVFITDTLGDVREGAKCGVTSIGVLWGFHDQKTLEKDGILEIAEKPEELPVLVKKHFSRK